MKVFKLICLFINHDDLDDEEVADLINDARYPNHIIGPEIMEMTGVEIGPWEDSNPLNSSDTQRAEFDRLFPPEGAK